MHASSPAARRSSARRSSARTIGDVFGARRRLAPAATRPVQCANIQIEVLLVDVSRSMRKGGLFERVQAGITDYVKTQVPDCTLEIVASFGLTADIPDAAFLTGTEGRDR